MKNPTPHENRRVRRNIRLAAFALTAAGVVAAAGTAAAPASAAPSVYTPAKLEHGLLTVKGTAGRDEIVLRLQAGSPEILEVDVGHGYADYSFERDDVTRIVVTAQAGGDLVSIDESNGAFTDSIPTTVRGGSGRDTLAGGSGAEILFGGDGNDSIDGNKGNDTALMGAGATCSSGIPATAATSSKARRAHDTMLFNGAGNRRPGRPVGERSRLQVLPQPRATSPWTPPASKQVDFKALDGADLVTVNDLAGTDVDDVNLDLAGTPGGTTADAQPPTASSSTAPTATTRHPSAGTPDVWRSAVWRRRSSILHPGVAERPARDRDARGHGRGGLRRVGRRRDPALRGRSRRPLAERPGKSGRGLHPGAPPTLSCFECR